MPSLWRWTRGGPSNIPELPISFSPKLESHQQQVGRCDAPPHPLHRTFFDGRTVVVVVVVVTAPVLNNHNRQAGMLPKVRSTPRCERREREAPSSLSHDTASSKRNPATTVSRSRPTAWLRCRVVMGNDPHGYSSSEDSEDVWMRMTIGDAAASAAAFHRPLLGLRKIATGGCVALEIAAAAAAAGRLDSRLDSSLSHSFSRWPSIVFCFLTCCLTGDTHNRESHNVVPIDDERAAASNLKQQALDEVARTVVVRPMATTTRMRYLPLLYTTRETTIVRVVGGGGVGRAGGDGVGRAGGGGDSSATLATTTSSTSKQQPATSNKGVILSSFCRFLLGVLDAPLLWPSVLSWCAPYCSGPCCWACCCAGVIA